MSTTSVWKIHAGRRFLDVPGVDLARRIVPRLFVVRVGVKEVVPVARSPFRACSGSRPAGRRRAFPSTSPPGRWPVQQPAKRQPRWRRLTFRSSLGLPPRSSRLLRNQFQLTYRKPGRLGRFLMRLIFLEPLLVSLAAAFSPAWPRRNPDSPSSRTSGATPCRSSRPTSRSSEPWRPAPGPAACISAPTAASSTWAAPTTTRSRSTTPHSFELVSRIRGVPAPETFDLHPDGRRLIVSNEEDAVASVYDVDDGGVPGRISDRGGAGGRSGNARWTARLRRVRGGQPRPCHRSRRR